MTEERMNELIEAIEAYEDKEKLFAMSPEDATAELNAVGYNFTVDEINEIGRNLVEVAKGVGANGELDADMLNGVVGGCTREQMIALIGWTAFCAITGIW